MSSKNVLQAGFFDDNRSIPEVCALMDGGPPALRRWIDQIRKVRQKSTRTALTLMPNLTSMSAER
ncbi:hypothetical protein [Pseudomonas psychrophila]|uniref:Transposase n=1 Tax=Pseudomonas psychrophila TaxID=122355 RepID=A0ABY0VQY9_9PSED|nr:hypothetical protein [Pseudomonas psychrophila]KAB0486048.1 hypothetical protein F7Q95_21035 [Pseudomonas psychrophila]KMN02487.1 hypothetical protein TU76_01490 [Pseudomonas psychrophila]QIE32544.1 hypothetical protein G5J76_09945 [Pseudomonas psychrophila]WVI99089.1 hypothetical protein VR624_06995 [Pseudomonas psychrophila]SDU50048.1 hypothetical protein SAMN04490201_2085 [Pseudomonas psychrophila]